MPSRFVLPVSNDYPHNDWDGIVRAWSDWDPSWSAPVELLLQPLFPRCRPSMAHARFPYSEVPEPVPTNVWLSGAALMIARSVYMEGGGLDKEFFPGIEDAALCRAVRGTGRGVALVPRARVIHEGGVSGFRSSSDSERVALALGRVNEGWIRYWRAYRGSGIGSVAALRPAFIIFGASRFVAFAILATLPSGARRELRRVRRDAYRRYIRLVIRGLD
jgi:GT2 family glycosyltransferase